MWYRIGCADARTHKRLLVWRCDEDGFIRSIEVRCRYWDGIEVCTYVGTCSSKRVTGRGVKEGCRSLVQLELEEIDILFRQVVGRSRYLQAAFVGGSKLSVLQRSSLSCSCLGAKPDGGSGYVDG